MTAPKPGGLYALRPVLSNGSILGRETVTSMQRRVSSIATVAGVNGDLFTWDEGLPSGVLMQDGVLKTPPHSKRSSVGVTDDGRIVVERVAMLGQWWGSSQRRPLTGLNQRPGNDGVSLFTPAWGTATPAATGTVEVTLQPFPPAAPFTDLTGVVTQAKPGGSTPIPPDGAVLVGRGTSAGRLAAEAPVGQSLTARLILRPQWGGVTDAIGGGPLIVKDGVPVFRALEDFSSYQLSLRHPRTGIGQRPDGSLVFVAVDGRQPGYSSGMTNFELAQTLVRLGVAQGSALDAGGSTTMAFDGKLLNRPSDRPERAVSDSLMVFYYGVHAPPPTEQVLSPNGDGLDELQSLSFKLVRPSTVTASLVGPDRVPRQTQTGERLPGVYKLAWNGRTPGGGRRSPGQVALGRQRRRQSQPALGGRANLLAQRDAGPPARLPPSPARPPRGTAFRIGFRLAAPARVRVMIETSTGVRVRTVSNRFMRAGTRRVVWNGRYGNSVLARRGSYLVRVLATNSYGPTELTQRFSVRRPAASPHESPVPAAKATPTCGPPFRTGGFASAGRSPPGCGPDRGTGSEVNATTLATVPGSILSSLTDALTSLIGDHGLYAIFILMLVDAVLPAASELVMVYGGALAAGAFVGQDVVLFGETIEPGFWAYFAVAMSGTLGYTVGSLIGWAIGLYAGRPFLEKHGRWLHLGPDKLERADHWFERFGDLTVFVGPRAPGGPVVHRDSGRDRAREADPLHGAHLPRHGAVVLRPGRHRLRLRPQLRAVPGGLALRRLCGRSADRGRGRLPVCPLQEVV